MTAIASQPEQLNIVVERLPHAEDLPLPALATAGSAGFDLVAANLEDQPILLAPGERTLVPTGLKMMIPFGFEGQIRPRSGLALKHGVTVLNAPGTIDSDYRGEISVLLINLNREEYRIHRTTRVAQIVFAACRQVTLTIGQITETARGEGGFGSTGSVI